MQPEEQLAVVLPEVVEVASGIQPSQLGDPTPCSEFTVGDVLDHMVVLGGTFAHLFRGEEAPQIDPPAASGRDPLPEFRSTMDDLLDAVRSPGAMERTVTAPVGQMPGETFARMVALDGLVHGWDLATATGRPYEVPAPVVAAVDEFARGALTPEMRSGGFAQPTKAPPGADRLQGLVAFTGRRVGQ